MLVKQVDLMYHTLMAVHTPCSTIRELLLVRALVKQVELVYRSLMAVQNPRLQSSQPCHGLQLLCALRKQVDIVYRMMMAAQTPAVQSRGAKNTVGCQCISQTLVLDQDWEHDRACAVYYRDCAFCTSLR